jgi:hypothetical protein
MVTKRNVILFLGAVGVAGSLLMGYWFMLHKEPGLCIACHRRINDRARAVVRVDGKTETVCCIRCGLTIERQEHREVRLVEVTDYNSGKPLRPDAAHYVEGSSVILCDHQHSSMVDPAKRPYEMVFDRCLPSIFAFASQEEAERFASSNGGSVLVLTRLVEEVEQR